MKALPNRINLVTLGVSDVKASAAFYESLGFSRAAFESDDISFFQLDGTVLALFGSRDLAEDAGVEPPDRHSAAMTVAINFATREDVDAAFELAQACGARIVQPARQVVWGGYSGYFADPDGHLWELAYNPHFQLDARGHFALPLKDQT